MINLIPPHILLRRETKTATRKWSIRLLILSGVCSCLFLGSLRLIEHQEKLVENSRNKYNLVLNQLNESQALLTHRDQIWDRWDTIRSIHNPRTSAWFLELLSVSLPNESYLNSLRFTLPGDRGPGLSNNPTLSPGRLGFSGTAAGHREVGEIIQALSASGAFRDVNLISVSDPGRVAGNNDLLFEMQCITAERLSRGSN